jgi:hypothetical protein
VVKETTITANQKDSIMPRCHAYTKSEGKRCTQTAKRRYCHRHRESKNRGVQAKEKEKPKPSRKMSNEEKLKRWGKVVARYRSRTTSKIYSVRKKGKKLSCNCPGWRFKKEDKRRSCAHLGKARKKLMREALAAK